MKNAKNIVFLFLTAMIWGSGFVAQSDGMNYVEPFTFLCVRNILGTAFLCLTMPLIKKISGDNTPKNNSFDSAKDKALKKGDYRRDLIVGGVCTGTFLCLASALQQIGIKYTTVGKAGFLTAMYVIIVPFLSLIIFKKKPDKKIWFCVLLAVIGMALLCLKGAEGIQIGDVFELLCAVAFSGHILIIDHFTEKVNPVELSCVQFLVCGILAAIPMFIFEKPSFSILMEAWLPIVYAGVLASGIAYTLQAVGQKNCDPTIASLILCLESVFAAVFGWILLNEVMSVKEIIGSVLMFIAIVLANIKIKGKEK